MSPRNGPGFDRLRRAEQFEALRIETIRIQQAAREAAALRIKQQKPRKRTNTR